MMGLALDHVSEEGHRMVIEDGNLSLSTKRKDLTSAIYMSNDNNTKIFLFVFSIKSAYKWSIFLTQGNTD